MKRKKLLLTTAVLALAGATLVVADDQGWIEPEEAQQVTSARVERSTIVTQVEAEGKLYSATEVPLASDVSGEVVELLVKEGEHVRKGQLLLRVRPDTYQAIVGQQQAAVASRRAGVAQAQAQLRQQSIATGQAARDYERQAALYEAKVISRADFEAAQAAYGDAKGKLAVVRAQVAAAQGVVRSAGAELAQAAKMLEKTAVYAPVSGVVAKLYVQQGEHVVGTAQMAGTPLLRVADPEAMEVRTAVNERDIIEIKAGDSAEVTISSYARQGLKLRGIVTLAAPAAVEKPTQRGLSEYEVRVRVLPESYQHLVPAGQVAGDLFRAGSKATIIVTTAHRANVLSVPLGAVTTRPKRGSAPRVVYTPEEMEEMEEGAQVVRRSGPPVQKEIVVFMVRQGLVFRKVVKVGANDLHNIEILDGLTPGTEIVTGPYYAVSKGLHQGSLVVVKADADLDRTVKYPVIGQSFL